MSELQSCYWIDMHRTKDGFILVYKQRGKHKKLSFKNRNDPILFEMNFKMLVLTWILKHKLQFIIQVWT